MKKKILCIIMSLVLLFTVVPVSAKAKPRLNKKTVYMSTADKVKLKVLNNKKKVKWTSSNKKVARVSKKGTVTPRWFGKTTITAKFGKKKLKCKVYVKEEDYWMDDTGVNSVSVMNLSKKKARLKLNIGTLGDRFTVYAKRKSNMYVIKRKGKSGYYYTSFISSRGMCNLNMKTPKKKYYNIEFWYKSENS